jgi:hypothetical protein
VAVALITLCRTMRTPQTFVITLLPQDDITPDSVDIIDIRGRVTHVASETRATFSNQTQLCLFLRLYGQINATPLSVTEDPSQISDD